MTQIVSQTDHGVRIVNEEGIAEFNMQTFIDDLVIQLNLRLLGNQIVMETYLKTELPPVPDITFPGLIFVSDASPQPVPAFSDGTDWRSVITGSIIS